VTVCIHVRSILTFIPGLLSAAAAAAPADGRRRPPGRLTRDAAEGERAGERQQPAGPGRACRSEQSAADRGGAAQAEADLSRGQAGPPVLLVRQSA
jgi:hypothetical protein